MVVLVYPEPVSEQEFFKKFCHEADFGFIAGLKMHLSGHLPPEILRKRAVTESRKAKTLELREDGLCPLVTCIKYA